MYLYITNSVDKTKSSKYLTVVNSLFFVPALWGSLSLFCKVNITSEFFSRVKLQGLLLSILTSNFLIFFYFQLTWSILMFVFLEIWFSIFGIVEGN